MAFACSEPKLTHRIFYFHIQSPFDLPGKWQSMPFLHGMNADHLTNISPQSPSLGYNTNGFMSIRSAHEIWMHPSSKWDPSWTSSIALSTHPMSNLTVMFHPGPQDDLWMYFENPLPSETPIITNRASSRAGSTGSTQSVRSEHGRSRIRKAFS